MEETKTKQELSKMVFEAMNGRDFSVLDPYLAEDLSLDFPGVDLVVGSRRVQIFIKAVLRKYPELTFTVKEVFLSGDRTFVVWENKGKDTAGNPYSNRGLTHLQFRDDQILFMSDYFKDTSFINPLK